MNQQLTPAEQYKVEMGLFFFIVFILNEYDSISMSEFAFSKN